MQAYLDEKAYRFSAEEFVAHYTACGWVQGNSKKPLVDWKASCVGWHATWLEKNKAVAVAASDWGKDRPAGLDAQAVDNQTAALPLEEAESADGDGYLGDDEA